MFPLISPTLHYLSQDLCINCIVDGVESHSVALLVGYVIVGEVGGTKNYKVTLGHIPT
jgi:hypothetical protein